MNPMRPGSLADHGGVALGEQLLTPMHAAGDETIDSGARFLDPEDGYPELVVPLASALAAGEFQRVIALCDSGVGAAVRASKP